MKLTAKMRALLVEKHGLAEDASDEEASLVFKRVHAAGKISDAEMKECEMDGAAKAEDLANSIAQKTAEGVSSVLGAKFDQLIQAMTPQEKSPEKKEEKQEEKEAPVDVTKSPEFLAMQSRLDALESKKPEDDGLDDFSLLKGAPVDDENGEPSMRVKLSMERFDHNPTQALYKGRPGNVMNGQPLTHPGLVLNEPTPRRKAMGVAWFKHQVMPEALTDNDKCMVKYILEKEKFYINNSTTPRLLTPNERIDCVKGHQKATVLIDDSTSGGENAVPEFFDTDFILLPILGGEVSPLVTIKDVPRGSSADTFTMANPTYAANTEGTAVTLFTTDSFIANHDTSFYRAMGAMEIGRNFLDDAVPGLADEIVGAYSRKAAEWLDQQICTGDGTTEPQGITNASGTVDITLGTPTTGPWVISDVLNLLFGVTKAFRQNYPSSRAGFAMTDATYKRLRSIATGVTGDTRLIFGNDVESYMLFGHPVSIEENGLTGADTIFCQWGGYRLYRRQGVRFRRVDSGLTLAQRNSIAIVSDMRFGGQLDRGGYAAVLDSAPTS